MTQINPRLRAVLDLSASDVREYGGRHEYDGKVQDLSPAGVRAGLDALAAARGDGSANTEQDSYDEAHLAVFERMTEVAFGELEQHRSNPFFHLANLDLACYDRDYAPEEVRAKARAEHAAAWPEAVDAAIASLDRIPAPVAQALADAVGGLAAGLPDDLDDQVGAEALAAHGRLVRHVTEAARNGDPDAALGTEALSKLMGSGEGLDLDLGQLAARADAERDRLLSRLADDCAKIDSARPALDVARELVGDHPDADGVLAAAATWTERAIEFTNTANLVPYTDGECVVALAPKSRRWAMAMMASAAPGEPDAPSMYYITPPDPSWPENEAREWLEVFSDTTLPGITVHEVAPGHFSHGRALRHAPNAIRQSLHSMSFVEGWAHYAEELCVEEGFRADDPRFAIGVWLEALVRVTRLASAIGLHTAGWTVADCARRFETDTHLSGQAAQSEAVRATFDPTYGRYTWGKLEIMAVRDQARQAWGPDFSLLRFHTAMLSLGSPPLGLLPAAIDRG
jgi:Bacterial protein of unknown function (DUF885)